MSLDLLDILSFEDTRLVVDILDRAKKTLFKPDVTLAPDGTPYLYRWHLRYDNEHGNVFFHIQVKSDPERPLHDHPWDNMSVILSGGYDELYEVGPSEINSHPAFPHMKRSLRKGDTTYRKATTAHRLILPPEIPYTMTLFSTGPKVRAWGFWYPDGFHDAKRHVNDRDPRGSVHVEERV